MVFKQDTIRIEDFKTRRNDDKGKGPLNPPTISLDSEQRPSNLEVVDTIHFYDFSFLSKLHDFKFKTHNMHTLFLHALY